MGFPTDEYVADEIPPEDPAAAAPSIADVNRRLEHMTELSTPNGQPIFSRLVP